ncbi:MAG TPA: alanine--tRNA ligase-related protein, partial [bacterium]|nr:alanine--tRNA ligase-related protein [bacterium]
KDSSEITRHMRIVADHIRASVFLAMDGVLPSNKDQGYVLRRLLRRIVRSGKVLGLEKDISVGLVGIVVDLFSWLYPQLPELQSKMEEIFADEEAKFRKTLHKASREVEKFLSTLTEGITLSEVIAAQQSAVFYQSFGYPPEDFFADLKERNINLDKKQFLSESQRIFEEHKEKSRAGVNQKFKGGLADSEEITVKYHTTAHLLHAALIQVTKSHATQAGSNINSERIRFDFNFDRLLSPEELAEVEKLVNGAVAQKMPVNFVILDKEEAVATGAMHLDLDKYGDKVKVYYVGDSLEEAFSKEFCGGPHVENTADLCPISIYKQEKMGRGVVRVYVKFVKS